MDEQATRVPLGGDVTWHIVHRVSEHDGSHLWGIIPSSCAWACKAWKPYSLTTVEGRAEARRMLAIYRAMQRMGCTVKERSK